MAKYTDDEIRNMKKITCKIAGVIIPAHSEPPVRILRATIPENESH